jgi:hypothetical protein
MPADRRSRAERDDASRRGRRRSGEGGEETRGGLLIGCAWPAYAGRSANNSGERRRISPRTPTIGEGGERKRAAVADRSCLAGVAGRRTDEKNPEKEPHRRLAVALLSGFFSSVPALRAGHDRSGTAFVSERPLHARGAVGECSRVGVPLCFSSLDLARLESCVVEQHVSDRLKVSRLRFSNSQDHSYLYAERRTSGSTRWMRMARGTRGGLLIGHAWPA